MPFTGIRVLKRFHKREESEHCGMAAKNKRDLLLHCDTQGRFTHQRLNRDHSKIKETSPSMDVEERGACLEALWRSGIQFVILSFQACHDGIIE